MKKIFFAMCLAGMSLSGFAADPISRELAAEYLQATNMRGIVETSLQEAENRLDQRVAPEKRAKLHALLEKAMGWEVSKEALTTVIAETYTAPELKAYLAFLKTPEGNSFNSKNEEFTRRYSAVIAAQMQEVFRESRK